MVRHKESYSPWLDIKKVRHKESYSPWLDIKKVVTVRDVRHKESKDIKKVTVRG